MKILAVHRKAHFSPNHVGNDAAIFNAVCTDLIARGAVIELCDEEEFLRRTVVAQDFIITMARSKASILKLQDMERKGKVIMNAAWGIAQCFRKNMTLALLENEIPYPKSYITATTADIKEVYQNLGGPGVWIKRGDFHAIHKEDVSFATSVEQAQYILSEYALRNIDEAVISEHLPGDLVKFYAVRDTGFFYWFYPYEHNHHKYETYASTNGNTLHHPFDPLALQRVANRAAAAMGIHIYGGDAIIGTDGSFHIIDFNDWPSFAPCREVAGKVIADFLFNYFNNHDATRETDISD